MNLVLIGYRGTGKSTVAQRLALSLGWEWVDADVEIELRAGKSIAAIFADDGEEGFRDLESAVIAEFASRDQIILAAGGGAVLRPENRTALAGMGKLVWLRARPETILARVAADSTSRERRPNLTTVGGYDEVVQLLRQRTPIYQQCADVTVDTDGKTAADVAAEILERLVLVKKDEG